MRLENASVNGFKSVAESKNSPYCWMSENNKKDKPGYK